MIRIVLAITILAAFVGAASAQQPDKVTRTKAAAHFKQGKEFFKTKQWDQAIVEYEAAWALVPEPLLQFNIALALEQKGDPEAALERFRRYLDLDPKGKVSDEAREAVARLTKEVDELVAAREEARRAEEQRLAAEAAEADRLRLEQERKDAEERRRQDEERAKLEADARRAEEERAVAARADARRRAAPLRGRARTLGYAGYGAIGVAAISGVTAAIFGTRAAAASDELSAHTAQPWTDTLLAAEDRGRTAQTVMYVGTGVAVASVIGGAVLIVMSRRAGAEATRLERVTIAPGPGLGLAVGGAF